MAAVFAVDVLVFLAAGFEALLADLVVLEAAVLLVFAVVVVALAAVFAVDVLVFLVAGFEALLADLVVLEAAVLLVFAAVVVALAAVFAVGVLVFLAAGFEALLADFVVLEVAVLLVFAVVACLLVSLELSNLVLDFWGDTFFTLIIYLSSTISISIMGSLGSKRQMTSCPWITRPNTVCLPSKCGCGI